eukprot:3437556-Pyramimonas_sp.AAC.1
MPALPQPPRQAWAGSQVRRCRSTEEMVLLPKGPRNFDPRAAEQGGHQPLGAHGLQRDVVDDVAGHYQGHAARRGGAKCPNYRQLGYCSGASAPR